MENSGMNVAGIESFEMRKLERLHLDLSQADSGKTAGQPMEGAPVEINCLGPFRFDVVGRVATFNDSVNVKITNPSGPADQLACNVLSLHFTDRTKDNNVSASQTPGSLNLELERIEAQGKPVVVTAPSKNVIARAEQFEYNLRTNSIMIRDGREIFLQEGSNEIHAKSLRYQATRTGQLGQLESQGPGSLRGQSRDRPGQIMEATWKEFLRIDRDNQDPRISLTGGAELRYPGVAQLQSKQIYFWLRETPSATQKQQYEYHPSRMAARDGVHMNSEQLACRVDDLQVWFEEKAEKVVSGQWPVASENQQTSSINQQSSNSQSPIPNPSSQQAVAQQAAPQQAVAQPNTTIPGIGRVQVDGRMLTAKILLTPLKPIVSNLTIKDNVHFQEIQTSQPGERPLMLSGDLLEAENLSEPNAKVTVTGRETRFEGRGMGLSGTNINLDCGANRLWINGPGQMDLPLSDVQQAPMPTNPGMLTVDWQRGMSFDGRTAQFVDSVVATARQLPVDDKTLNVELSTGIMDVQLQQPIRFSGQQTQGPNKVQAIRCRSGVNVENRSFDLQQQLYSHDRMQTTDFGVDLLSGEMIGGPGWINSVYRGSAELPGEAPANNIANPSDQLNGLHVRFQRSIRGNAFSRQLTFDDQVQLANAPVNNWDVMLTIDNVDKLGPQGIGATCDLLSIIQPLHPLTNQRSIELVAQGNVEVENATYMARGQRIAYNQNKGLLILQGDGRNDAELFQQQQPGASANKTAAQEIYYWLKTGQVKVVGARSLQIGQPPSEKRLK
jgi:lipopolysaccharide export system protein LptA